jgi:hypothetical protein
MNANPGIHLERATKKMHHTATILERSREFDNFSFANGARDIRVTWGKLFTFEEYLMLV